MRFALLVLALALACQGTDSDDGADTDTDVVDAQPFSLPDVVETTHGPVLGYRRTGETPYVGFVGVPYAEAERWQPPVDPAPWTEAFNASNPPSLSSPRCPQRLPIIGDSTDEDCLRLNLHAPDPVTPGTPVLVWLHGGGFTVGEGLQPGGGTSGHVLAGSQDVIVVSINYRLAALGWLVLDGVSQGNLGYLDTLAALRWVQSNIETFGGDPGNVTIVGESAGGGLVCLLMADDGATGLYHRAIIESASCQMGRTRADALVDGQAFADAAGCGDASDVGACLAELDGQDLVDLQFGGTEGQTLGSVSWGPHVDGDVIAEPPLDALAGGLPVPTIWGFNAQEGNADVVTGGGPDVDDDDDAYRTALEDRYGTTGAPIDGVITAYPLADYRDRFASPGDRTVTAATWALVASSGDEGTACPTRDNLAALADGEPLYAYEFAYPDGTWPLEGRGYGAFHFAEVQYVFGIHPETLFSGQFTDEERALHGAVAGYWTSFARDGVPSGDVDWPAWDAARDSFLRLDAPVSVTTTPKLAECAAIRGARGG